MALPTGTGRVHQLYDAAAIVPAAVAAAAAARAAAPAAAEAWLAQRLVEMLPSGALVGAAWAEAQSAARHTLRRSLQSLASAVAAGPRQTEAALLALRDTAARLRGGARSLSALVETRRVCRALDAAADAMLTHVTDAGVARAGAVALAGTGIWSARRPQRALAGALAVHAGDAEAAAALCATAALFTRSRLSSCPGARAIGGALAAALQSNAACAEVAPRALAALRHVIIHLTLPERSALDAGGALRAALAAAACAAEARRDAGSVRDVAFVTDALDAARREEDASAAAGLPPLGADAHAADSVAACQPQPERRGSEGDHEMDAAGAAEAEADSAERPVKRARLTRVR